MISHTHQCIFIHIPKAAGSSIEKKLGLFDELVDGVQDHRTIGEIEPFPVSKWLQFQYWKSLKGRAKGIVRRRRHVSVQNYHQYYKFTFVRNSWARAYSWYRNVIRDPQHQRKLNVSPDCSLNDFLRHHLDNNWALQSQLDWITDAQGNIPLDFIGRFETLKQDFAQVCQDIGVDDSSLPELLKEEHDTRTKVHYTEAFDAEGKDIIARVFKDEIKYFKFEFGE